MRRIIFAVLLVCAMCSGSYAVSEDMSAYVRQDVFDAKMDMLLTRLESERQILSEQINALGKRISSANIIGDIMKYLPFIILGAIVIMAYAAIFFEPRTKYRTPEVTIEDVKRLIAEAIAENNAKLRG